MPRHVVLLRGINLGPRRRIAMSDLRDLLTAGGHGEVRTHLQSGNVLLDSDLAPEELERDVAERLRDFIGMDVPVVVRSPEQLAEVVDRNPLADVASDPKRLQVTFLPADPPEEVARELNATDVDPERLVVDGREVYTWHPGGIQRSAAARLAGDRRLGPGTARNWNTILKLLELAER